MLVFIDTRNELGLYMWDAITLTLPSPLWIDFCFVYDHLISCGRTKLANHISMLYFSVRHQRGQFCSIRRSCVTLGGVNESCLRSASSSASVSWFPQHKVLCADFRVEKTGTSQLYPAGGDLIADSWQFSEQLFIGSVVWPVNIERLPSIDCVRKAPAFTAIEQNGLDGGDEEADF